MGHRLLVVDDEETIRGVICQVLTEEGFEVTEASNGEQALELFRKDPFPLVITDIYMGKMTGLDLLNEIKLLDSETMVVVMTSNASLETATRALRSGAYDYLTKPFEELDLILAVVNRAVDRARLVGANRRLLHDLQRNADELEQLNAKLTDMANRDGLTGLHNHRYFREALELEVARSRRHQRRFAVLFMDVDHFKHYNDNHGHLAGDALLRTVSRLLEERCRSSTLAARYGGEEFVLLVPELDVEGARTFADKIRRTVEEHSFPGQDLQPTGRVTLSLGVAVYPDSGEDSTRLIDHADKALYESKRNGRNLVSVWEPAPV